MWTASPVPTSVVIGQFTSETIRAEYSRIQGKTKLNLSHPNLETKKLLQIKLTYYKSLHHKAVNIH